MNNDSLRRRRDLAALALAAQLGGAGLIIDQRRNASLLPQLELQTVKFPTMMNGHTGRQVSIVHIFGRIIANDNNRSHALAD